MQNYTTITPFNTYKFGTRKHSNIFAKDNLEDDVTIAMATQPSRVNSYINTVWSLLSQCTRLCICFNGFDEIPDNLPKSHKIVAVCASQKTQIPDLGCDNKMRWIGDFNGYYATVDDDIIYPPNYISKLKTALKQYHNKIVVSFHGHIYPVNDGRINFSRRMLICYDKQHDDIWCHRLGMGTAMFHPKTIGITKDVFMSFPKNTGDDEIFAIWAQKNKIPMLCISTKNIQIFPVLDVALSTGLCTNRTSMLSRRRFLESYDKWKLNIMHSQTQTQNNDNTMICNAEVDNDDVTVAMASQPARKEQMLKVVEQLLPQCTRICIALNEYDTIPNELLHNDKIMAVLAGKNHLLKDLGNLNKMLWLGKYPGYYATVDDDLDYFPGYIDKLKSSLKKYGNKAICAFHGIKYDINDGKLDLSTKSILFYNKIIANDEVCLRPGMGTAMLHPSTIGINKYIYLKHEKGTSDDCLTSLWAQQHNIPCIVVGREKIYMDATKYAFDGLYRNKDIQLARNKMMQSYTNWKYLEI